MNKKKAVLRADGNLKIGLGHIYRCIAIAEMIQLDFDCEFLLGYQSQFENVIPKQFTVKHIPHNYAIDRENQWIQANYDTNSLLIILDGYHFNSAYQKSIKKTNAKLVYIDDLLNEHMCADIVINHSPNVTINLYKKEKYTKIYTGLEYVLLRKRFLEEASEKKEKKNKISSALITLGGSDEYNITLKILISLLNINQINSINIVIGVSYPHTDKLKQEVARSSKNIKVFSNLSELEMIELMRNCDIAFAPSSTTSLELISVNSVIFGGYSAYNQEYLYNYLKAQQLIFDLGDLQKITSNEISDVVIKHINNEQDIAVMIASQRQVIDGKSGERILKIIKELI